VTVLRAARGLRLGRDLAAPSGKYRWVYLWGMPIRIMHWSAVLAILVLIVTGFYIGRPYFITSGEASEHYLMGWMRFLHFAAAGVLVGAAILRAYWLFAGNQFERWRALFPVFKQDWIHLWQQVKYYLLIHPEKAPHYLGHNPLQQLSYTGMYLVAALMVLTGFALYGQSQPGGFFHTLFAWIIPHVGGLQIVRFVHHVLTWAFLIFLPVHVYLAVRADLLERTGGISSIVTGGRFVRADVRYVDEPK
jgi:Ni/Fe-hydrogenase b-type cytochrome subunit